MNSWPLLSFHITSQRHDWVKHLSRLRTNKSFRVEQNSAMLAGSDSLLEAFPHLQIKRIAWTPNFPSKTYSRYPLQKWNAFFTHLQKQNSINYTITPELAQKILGLSSTPTYEIFAEVVIPSPKITLNWERVLVLDGVSDPGNMGSLIRTAFGCGWDGVLTLSNSCDPYSDKAIRASKGTVFRFPVLSQNHGSKTLLQGWEKNEQVRFIFAERPPNDLETFETNSGIIYFRNDLQQKSCIVLNKSEEQEFLGDNKLVLILGNESHGINQSVISKNKNFSKSLKVGMMMERDLDSLNVAVAGGILLHFFKLKKSKEFNKGKLGPSLIN